MSKDLQKKKTDQKYYNPIPKLLRWCTDPGCVALYAITKDNKCFFCGNPTEVTEVVV